MIKITADSMCDLSPELVERYDVGVQHIHVALGENDYIDGVTMKTDDIYEYYKNTKKLPKTGASSVEEFEAFFRPYVENGDTVIHFDISQTMSACYNNAKIAAEKLGNVYVIDTKSLSTGIALLMLDACDMAAAGMSAEDIVARVEKRIPNVQASFVVDTLEFLYKGGRCSSLAYLGANLLQIKPSIQLIDGNMEVSKKYFGSIKRALGKYIDDTFQKFNNPCTKRCFVTHTKLPDEILNMAVEQVKAKGIFEEVLETTAGCSVTTHCGAGTLGVLYLNDGDEYNN